MCMQRARPDPVFRGADFGDPAHRFKCWNKPRHTVRKIAFVFPTLSRLLLPPETAAPLRELPHTLFGDRSSLAPGAQECPRRVFAPIERGC